MVLIYRMLGYKSCSGDLFVARATRSMVLDGAKVSGISPVLDGPSALYSQVSSSKNKISFRQYFLSHLWQMQQSTTRSWACLLSVVDFRWQEALTFKMWPMRVGCCDEPFARHVRARGIRRIHRAGVRAVHENH